MCLIKLEERSFYIYVDLLALFIIVNCYNFIKFYGDDCMELLLLLPLQQKELRNHKYVYKTKRKPSIFYSKPLNYFIRSNLKLYMPS